MNGKDETLIDFFFKAVSEYRDRPAFFYFDQTWRKLTYGQFSRSVTAIASYLIKGQAKTQFKIAIISENRIEWCAAYLGIIMAGGTAVLIDDQLGSEEIGKVLSRSDTALLFHSGKLKSRIGNSVAAINFDSPRFKEICETPEADSYPSISAEDVASIVYTSGTTGAPKGVMLTHRNFCSDARALIDFELTEPGDNILAVLPYHHTYPFMCAFLLPLFTGASITFSRSLKSLELLSTIRERGVTIFVAVPRLLEIMRNGITRRLREKRLSFLLLSFLGLCRRLRRTTGLNMGRLIFRSIHQALGSRFRFFTSGGARLDPKVMEDLEAIGFTVLEGYGLTETSPVVTFNQPRKRKPGSAGRPLPSVEIKVLRPSQHEEGEIVIRGPMVMKGYYKDPEATAEAIKDRWLLTGDLGYLDEGNYLYITGRSKEVIVLSSGQNVYPEEVEKEYLAIPLIKEICVTALGEKGMETALYGIVVPNLDRVKKEGIINVHGSLREAVTRVSMKLPPPMRLKGFTLHGEPLPRTPLGKMKRFMVKDLLTKKPLLLKDRGEDRRLMEDEAGRRVAGCIMPLLREKVPVHSSDHLELDLGLDSLQRIELVASIEKTFSLKLPSDFLLQVPTVGDLAEKIKEMALAPSPLERKATWKERLANQLSEEEKKEAGLEQGRVARTWRLTFFKMMRGWLRSFFHLQAKGIENLPDPPFIIAPNHTSYLDGFLIAAVLPEKLFDILYFQGLRKYYIGRPRSLFARIAHVIPIDDEAYLMRAIRISSYVLRNNRILCIFPEGERSLDGSIKEFKKGIGILSVELGVPVVPAWIEGAFQSLPRGAKWPRPARIRVTFGRPLRAGEVDFSQSPGGMDGYDLFALRLRERVQELAPFP